MSGQNNAQNHAAQTWKRNVHKRENADPMHARIIRRDQGKETILWNSII